MGRMSPRPTATATAVAAALVAVALGTLAGCGGLQNAVAVPAQVSCRALVGRMVSSPASCIGGGSDHATPCHVGGKMASGDFYYFSTDALTVYGRDDGRWKSGPASMSTMQIAARLGC
jgi:hypothetical protein